MQLGAGCRATSEYRGDANAPTGSAPAGCCFPAAVPRLPLCRTPPTLARRGSQSRMEKPWKSLGAGRGGGGGAQVQVQAIRGIRKGRGGRKQAWHEREPWHTLPHQPQAQRRAHMTQHHDSTGRPPSGQPCGISRMACSKVEIICLLVGQRHGWVGQVSTAGLGTRGVRAQRRRAQQEPGQQQLR